MSRILIVDDEVKLAAVAGEMLTLDGHHVERAASHREAVSRVNHEDFDLVLTDLRLPDGDGLSVLREARRRSPPAEVVLMTAYGSTDNAVEAMKGGAADYLTKPFAMDELRMRVRRIAEASDATRLSARLVQQLTPRLIAESQAMKATLQLAERAAATDQPVLISGESGTGKTQLARLIHYLSRRRAGTLSELHCASLSAAALEKELFGGITETTGDGKVVAANHGTLFLDEIGDLEPSLQASLLRLLQSGDVANPSANTPTHVDIRLVATTNRDLRVRVAESRFREDLFYRLNVLSITVPPLRERQSDIIPLAERVLARHGLKEKRLTAATRQRLLSYDWPGNVRELENSLERAIVLAGDGEIAPIHFDFPRASASAAPGPQQVLVPGFNLDAFERDLVFSAIERAGGNKAAAARLLGITRRRLYSRLQSFEDRFGETAEEV